MTTAHEPGGLAWRKSSYSGGNGDCVEVACDPAGVRVRDTKDRAAGALTVDRHGWGVFLAGLAVRP
ncbi:DUF397 domain-containing protein [Amycolatopsis palatopharyngis]|uniref:DUF397 domain-containing protein n=1 Tax=Amycolatopsis palatopharyngis TaxID=187982 RepID=UPI000E255692|nr:DUF397 domain-containing protein [Amycolatopsis palatopharyngis]